MRSWIVGPVRLHIGCASVVRKDSASFFCSRLDWALSRPSSGVFTHLQWQGYWAQPEKSEETFQAHTKAGEGPYLRTGDLGFLHEGNLYITGRHKELIILKGRNYYPQDVETCVLEASDVLRPGCCAAFSVDVDDQEQLVVVAEVRSPFGLAVEAIFDAIRNRLLRQEDLRPHALVLIRPRSIPKTSSGKIRRRACRDAFLSEELSRETRDLLPASAHLVPLEVLRNVPVEQRKERLTQSLQSALADALEVPAAEVDPNSSLQELGLDSLTIATLTSAIEHQLAVPLDLDFLLSGPSPQLLARHILSILYPDREDWRDEEVFASVA